VDSTARPRRLGIVWIALAWGASGVNLRCESASNEPDPNVALEACFRTGPFALLRFVGSRPVSSDRLRSATATDELREDAR